jgi:hypothetical protein
LYGEYLKKCNAAAVSTEYNIAIHYNFKGKEKYKNSVGALKRKSCDFSEGLAHNRMSSENNPIIVTVPDGQVIMFLTCWLKKPNIFGWGIHKKIFAKQPKRFVWKKRLFLTQ